MLDGQNRRKNRVGWSKYCTSGGASAMRHTMHCNCNFAQPLTSSIDFCLRDCKAATKLLALISKSVASSIVQSKCPTASSTSPHFCNRYFVHRKGRQVVPCMPAVHGGCVISVSSFQAVDACQTMSRAGASDLCQ